MAHHDYEPPHRPAIDDHEWSSDNEITEDEIAETFDQCPHCGTYIVRCNGSHSCISADYQPHADEPERRRRIEASPFPDDDPVLIRDHPTSRAYAYHEPNSKNKPLCWPDTDASLATLSRAAAHDQLLAPCQHCESIRQKREADQ